MSADSILRRQCEVAFAFIHSHVLKEREWSKLHGAVSAYEKRCDGSCMMEYFYTLPILSCMAVGGTAERAIPLTGAWILYDLASDIFDDIQDRDRKDLPWNHWPPDQAMLVGVGALFAADLCLASLETDDTARVEIQRTIADAGLQAARGQSIPGDNLSLRDYFQRTIANTGVVLASILWAGARLWTSDQRHLSALYDYGLALGTLLQLWDDCVDLQPSRLVSDLARKHYTLPILYALSQTDHPQYGRLAYLLHQDNLTDPQDVTEVVQLLHEMRTWPFIVAMAKAYEQKALAALEVFPHGHTTFLREYVERIFRSFVDR